MKNILVVLFIVSFAFAGCRKACTTVTIGDLSPPKGFITVTGTAYKMHRGVFGSSFNGKLDVINDTISYNDLFKYTTDLPFQPGSVNFSEKTLVFYTITVGSATGINTKGGLFYNPVNKNYVYLIEYALMDQCKGSGLRSQSFMGILVCPKLPANVDIGVILKDVNPL